MYLSDFPHHKPTIYAKYFSFTTNEGVLKGGPIFDFEPNLGYEVNSFVVVIKEPMVKIMNKMCEILDDIGIIIPDNGILPNRPLTGSLFL